MENQTTSYSNMVSWGDEFETGTGFSSFFDAEFDEASATDNLSDLPQGVNHDTQHSLPVAASTSKSNFVSSRRAINTSMATPAGQTAAVASPRAHYPSPAASYSSQHSSPVAVATIGPSLDSSLHDIDPSMATSAGRTAAVTSPKVHYPSPAATHYKQQSSPVAIAPAGPSPKCGQRNLSSSKTTPISQTARPFVSVPMRPESVPSVTTTSPPAGFAEGQNPERFIDGDVTFLATLIHDSMTTRNEFSDRLLCDHLIKTLRSRMHYHDFVNRISRVLDSFSPDFFDVKGTPIDAQFARIYPLCEASLAKEKATSQENGKLREENQRLRYQLNHYLATIKSVQQPHDVEIVRLHGGLHKYRQIIIVQQKKLKQMQASLSGMASLQGQQAPQTLSADQVISRYMAPPPQQPVTSAVPATVMPIQQHVLAISPDPIVQTQQHNAASTATSTSIPGSAGNSTIDLTSDDDSASNHVEAPAPAPQTSNKRKYEWMNAAAPTAALPRSTKMAKKTTAKTTVTEKKAAKQSGPKAPREKASRRASKKDRHGLSSYNLKQLREYRELFDHGLTKEQKTEVDERLRQLTEKDNVVEKAKEAVETDETTGIWRPSLEDQEKYRLQVEGYARRGMENAAEMRDKESNTEENDEEDDDENDAALAAALEEELNKEDEENIGQPEASQPARRAVDEESEESEAD